MLFNQQQSKPQITITFMSLISLYKLLTRTYLLYFKFYCSGKLSNVNSNTMETVAQIAIYFPLKY